MYQTKRMAGYLFAFLAVIQLAAFFLYYQTTAHVKIKWLVYLVYQIRNTAQAAVPLITAAAMLLLLRAGKKRIAMVEKTKEEHRNVRNHHQAAA